MEKVSKVLKSVPGNIQSQGFMEITSMVLCNSSYYSCAAKVQENWKNFEKFAEKEPMPWVKIAWMMVAGLKYPNLVLFQRIDGYKSSANFITSLDFENLLRFAKKQDERVSIRPRNSERPSIAEGKPPKSPAGVQVNPGNPSEKRNSFPRSQLELKDPYSRHENLYSNPDSRNSSSIDPISTEDISRKAYTPISRKYEFGENKSGSFDRGAPQVEKHLGSQQDLNFNSNPYLDPIQKPGRFDMAKGPLRKDDRSAENLHFARRNSPKAVEDTFRSWDRNEEMERIQLASPKDREKQFRTFSRQEEIQPKLSFTPQRMHQREVEKVTHYSPKEIDKVQSSSPYFNEKPSYRERYAELLGKDPVLGEEKPPVYGQREERKYREGYVEKNPENYEKEYRSEAKPMFSREIDSLMGKYEDFSSKDQAKFPSRNYKAASEDLEQEEPPRGYRAKYFGGEEESQKISNAPLENPMDRFKFQGAKDFGEPRESKEEPRYKDNRFLEEFYQRDRNKARDTGSGAENVEVTRPREYNFSSDEQTRDSQKPKAFSHESMEKESYDQRNFHTEDNDRFKFRNYRNPESDFKGELNARDLNIDDVDHEKDEIYPRPYEASEVPPRDFKFRDYSQEEPLAPEVPSKKYQPSSTKELYEKYKLPGSYKPKEDYSANEVQNPVYRQEEEYRPKYDYLGNKPEEYPGNAREGKRFEDRSEGYASIENSYERENQFKEGLVPRESTQYRPRKEEVRVERSSESNEFSDWSCSKCNKKVQGSLYECGDCRLINWDQFYKVKSLQHTKSRNEENSRPGNESSAKDESVRRLYSFSESKEEHSEWVCAGCSTSNKNIFFLCKSCRKPRAQGKDIEVSEPGRKEYKFNS